jgi:aminoethylphosphonate catabolism LysR family transcriptional regulator
MKSINSTLLKAFHAVCAEGGFTKAARLLNISQPTLSQQVKLLEETYGVRLFERSGRGVVPTKLAEELFVITRRLAAAEEEAEELLAGARRLVNGRLAVGADGPYHAVPLIRAFQESHPGPEVTLSVGNSADILQGLLETRLDVVVVSSLPGDSRLFVVPLRRDPILAMVPKDWPLARRRAVRMAELAEHRLIMREPGSVTRRQVERALQDLDLYPEQIMVIESREAVREAVGCGLGIGFVSAVETTPDARFLLLPIQDARVEMDEFVICLRERRRLNIVRAFLDIAEAEARKAAARPAL